MPFPPHTNTFPLAVFHIKKQLYILTSVIHALSAYENYMQNTHMEIL